MSEWLISRDMNMTRANVVVNLMHPENWEHKKNPAATPSALADWGFVIGRDVSPLGHMLMDGTLSWSESCILSLAKRGPADGDAHVKPFVVIMKALAMLQNIPERAVELTDRGFTRLTSITSYEEITVDFCSELNSPDNPDDPPISKYHDIWLNALTETGLFVRNGNSYELLASSAVRKFVAEVAAYGTKLSDCPSKKSSASDYYDYMGAVETGLPEIMGSLSPDVVWNIFPHFLKGGSHVASVEEAKLEGTKCVYQLITYGAPGTGKSFGVKDETKEKAFFRTTFHPDSDYASFVGAYKPTMRAVERTALVGKKLEMADVESVKDALKKEEVICYEFVAQVFTHAYVQAWLFQAAAAAGATPPRVYLVIEEINRGNCAQVFGDLFQLLDRNAGGFSDYPIRPDADLGTFLGAAFASVVDTFDAAHKTAINALYSEMEAGLDVVDEVLAGRLMVLPSNLLLRATMNTSDQSLFPMDSAFKRRWDWQYVPITDKGLGWTISAGGTTFGWWNFLAAVNGQIAATLKSADKQLGYFFVRPDDDSGKVISAARFVSKVLFFLYNDVFKDYDLPKAFAKPEGGTFAFGDFFLSDGTPDESAVQVFLSQLLTPSAA